MTPAARSPWKIASTAIALGLLGSCAATLALSAASGPAALRRASHGPPAAGRGSPLRLAARVPAPARRAASARGLLLMRAAAAACQNVPYSGVQAVSWWERGTATTSVLQVWHRPGGAMLSRAADTADTPQQAGPAGEPGHARDQAGALWISAALVQIMQANFSVGYAGQGAVDNRPAELVDLHRRDGTLAARFWLDAVSKLPLRRETFDGAARLLSEDAFISVALGAGGAAGSPAPAPAAAQPWPDQLNRADRAALRARGWPLLPRLRGGLVLFAVSHATTAAGEVVELSYSDGLSVVSLFVQRGQLSPELPGWHSATVGGRSVFVVQSDERSLAWSARGFVYTVIAAAPPATVADVVAGLPHQVNSGFVARMAHGFRRLISWANPFG